MQTQTQATEADFERLLDKSRQMLANGTASGGSVASSVKQVLGYSAIFSSICLMAAVFLVATVSAAAQEAPPMWTHGLIVLVVAQAVLIVGIMLTIGRRPFRAAKSISASDALRAADARPSVKMEAGDRIPPQVAEDGLIAGRSYVLYANGVVEVETLLGRRRFPSIEFAEEFLVGRQVSPATQLAA